MEIPSKSISWLRRDTEREYKYAINLFKNFGLVPLDLAGLGCGTQFAAGRVEPEVSSCRDPLGKSGLTYEVLPREVSL